MRINDLSTDLSDGLRLIALIEVLSQKHVGRFNKRPTFRQMKMENVAMALSFLEGERIKVSCRSIFHKNVLTSVRSRCKRNVGARGPRVQFFKKAILHANSAANSRRAGF